MEMNDRHDVMMTSSGVTDTYSGKQVGCGLLQSATLTCDKDTVREVPDTLNDTQHRVDLSPPTSSLVCTLYFSLYSWRILFNECW